jgi:hypothetical protein
LAHMGGFLRAPVATGRVGLVERGWVRADVDLTDPR